jgi:hypothetical protein
MITYFVKTNIANEDYIEMITSEGKITFVPMVEGNSDYQAYLKSLEAEQSTPIPTE